MYSFWGTWFGGAGAFVAPPIETPLAHIIHARPDVREIRAQRDERTVYARPDVRDVRAGREERQITARPDTREVRAKQ